MKKFVWPVLSYAAGVLVGVALIAAVKSTGPRYYWYDVAQTDSIRTLLVQNPGTRLKLEERTKNHIWVSVMRADSAAKAASSFEVEESFPCPPICR